MSDYKKDIEQEATDFILNNEDMIIEALVDDADWDYNEIPDLDSTWHESIVDRGYTLQDAAYIISECENEETDSGLWEGQQPEEAIKTKAAFSYALDCWFEAERIYDELKEDYQERESSDISPLVDEKERAKNVLLSFRNSQKIEPETDKTEQKRLIKIWLRLGEDAGLWSGYPVGRSYIDARCGSGHGMPEIKEYVDFDHEIARLIPAIAGKYKKDVVEYLEKL
jgi:hypothetical protein